MLARTTIVALALLVTSCAAPRRASLLAGQDGSPPPPIAANGGAVTPAPQAAPAGPAPATPETKPEFFFIEWDEIGLDVFVPKTRVYFDTGTDDAGEVDIFRDGELTVGINFLQLDILDTVDTWSDYDEGGDWVWGFSLGTGIGAPANDSSNGTGTSSGAPVVLFSAAGVLERRTNDSNLNLGVEAGWIRGWTTDETFMDTDDTAFFVGITVDIDLDDDSGN